jgi:2-methylcitrate dehydratase
MKVVPSEEADRTEKEFNLCELEVVLKSGARKIQRVEYHRGHFKNPMTDAEMEEKFRLLVGKHLPAERVDRLLRILGNIENEPTLGNLISATLV